MFEVNVNGRKQKYRSKPTMNVDTTGSSGNVSIPKPLTYDYMPEGYPKKDGWSVEWDGNIDGKTSAVGAPLYKFSDRVLTYEEFLSAKAVNPSNSSQFTMVSAMRPAQEKVSDAISVFLAGKLQIHVISEDNAGMDGVIFPTKGLYTNERAPLFKLIKETITPIATDFIPKNLNVVFSASSGVTPTSCNVTYDELRGWVENNIPVLSIYRRIDSDYVESITTIKLQPASLVLKTADKNGFTYNSDGTFSEVLES